jgi:hypothetical protein
LIGQIARHIGDEVICHIETMYPKAIEAAPSTFSLSVRNKIINEIMSVIAVNDADQVVARITGRKSFRRKLKASYRKMRATST